jgi:hypothetical protein
MTWTGHVPHTRREKFIRYFCKKRKISFERHKCNWEDNIKVDLDEMEWEGVDSFHLVQDSG